MPSEFPAASIRGGPVATEAADGRPLAPHLHPLIPLVVLGALPAVMLAISTLWIYSAAGLVDAWLYHGFFHLLRDFAPTNFGVTYYSSRLAWILPGFFAYQLLPPDAANTTLHLVFFYAAIFALYRATALLTNRSAALISSCAFATTTPTIVAFGWDYVDGAVITYTLVGMWLIVEASVSRQRTLLLVVAGAAAACVVHSNLAAALMGPVFVITYWCTHRDKCWLDMTAFVGGGVLVTVVLGLCNVLAGGPFLFFMPSVQWASASIGTDTFVPTPPLKWPGSARFVVPLVGLSAAAGAFATSRTPATRIGLLTPLWLTAAFIAYDWGTSGGLLQTQYYVSWFLPLAFVGVAGAIAPLSTPSTMVIVIAVCAAQLSALTLVPNRLHQLAAGSYPAITSMVELSVAIAALLLAGLVSWRSRPVTRSVVLALTLVIADFVAGPNLGYGLTADGRTQFELVQQTLTFLRRHVPRGARPVFWIQTDTVNSRYFGSIASVYLYLYSLASFTYPDLDDPTGKFPKPGANLNPGDYVLALTDTPANSVRIHQEFQDLHLAAEVIASTPVRANGAAFVETLLRVH